MAAVRLDDAGTALPDDMTDARVVLHLGEAGALPGRLVDRDDEPPLGPRLFQPRLAIAQLCLGEALICEAQIALGHVVHRIRRVEVRLHELARNDVVGAREAVTLRFDLRPLRDLRAVDLGEDELVQLHRKARRRRDRLRERRTRRHAVRRLSEEHQVVALSDAGLDERAHDRATDALAAMRGEDVHLGPARVRVLGLVLVPADEAGADERSRHIARGEGRAPLRWRRRAQARLDRVDRSEWVLRDALVVHRLEHSRRLGELGVGRGGRVGLDDLVAGGSSHSGSLRAVRRPTISGDTSRRDRARRS